MSQLLVTWHGGRGCWVISRYWRPEEQVHATAAARATYGLEGSRVLPETDALFRDWVELNEDSQRPPGVRLDTSTTRAWARWLPQLRLWGVVHISYVAAADGLLSARLGRVIHYVLCTDPTWCADSMPIEANDRHDPVAVQQTDLGDRRSDLLARWGMIARLDSRVIGERIRWDGLMPPPEVEVFE